MRKHLLILILPLLLVGCGDITRAEWDAARSEHDHYMTEFQTPEGDTVVVHHGLNPAMDFAGNYTCKSGIRVATFRDGVLIKRHWQDDKVLGK